MSLSFLEELSEELFQKIIDFMYSDSLQLESVGQAAQLFHIGTVLKIAERFLTICDNKVKKSALAPPPSTLGNDLQRFFSNPLFSDCSIRVEDTLIPVHKVLTSYSTH